MKHKPHAWIRNIVRLIVLAPFEVLIIFSASWTLGFSTSNTKTCHWTHSSASSVSLFHHDRMLKYSTSVFSQLSFFRVTTPQNDSALKRCLRCIPITIFHFCIHSAFVLPSGRSWKLFCTEVMCTFHPSSWLHFHPVFWWAVCGSV
jgi:hypothetical protein